MVAELVYSLLGYEESPLKAWNSRYAPSIQYFWRQVYKAAKYNCFFIGYIQERYGHNMINYIQLVALRQLKMET